MDLVLVQMDHLLTLDGPRGFEFGGEGEGGEREENPPQCPLNPSAFIQSDS